MGKNIFNTYSYSYINNNPDLTFGGYDSDGNPYWVDDSGKVYYQDNSMGQSSSGDGNQQGDNGNNQGNNSDPHNTGWNPANYGTKGSTYGAPVNIPVMYPSAVDIPQTGGPGKYTQESIGLWVQQTAQYQNAKNNGQPVVMNYNVVVGGVPVQKTVLLSPGLPGQPTYNTYVGGSLNPDGTLLNQKALTLTLPGLPGTPSGPQTLTSDSTPGSGPSGGGSGGPGGGSPSGGGSSSSTSGSDCDCGGSGGNGPSVQNNRASKAATSPDKNSVISTATVTDKYVSTDSSYSIESWWTYYGRTKELPTPAQKRLEDEYLKIRGKKEEIIAQADDKDAKIVVRFRFWDGTFDADGNENYSEDDVVIRDRQPGGKYEVYNVDYHVTKDGVTTPGQGSGAGWEHGFVNPYDKINRVEVLPVVPFPVFPPEPVSVNIKTVPDFLRVATPPPPLVPISLNFQPATDILLGRQPAASLQELRIIAIWLRNNPGQRILIEGSTPVAVAMNQMVNVLNLFGLPQRNPVRVRTWLRARANAVRNMLIRAPYNVNPNQVFLAPSGNTGNQVTTPSATFNIPMNPLPLFFPVNMPLPKPMPAVPVPDLPAIQL